MTGKACPQAKTRWVGTGFPKRSCSNKETRSKGTVDMTAAEFILAGDFLLTMDAQNRVISGGAAHISDGRILGVDSLDVLAAAYPSAPVRRVRDSVLIPGLINAHAHSGFLRGTAEHLPVWDWLTLHINPMHRVLLPHEAAAASRLCYAESAICATTPAVTMRRFM